MNENPHILIVDDDNRIRELIKEYLEENDFIVSTANDAGEASEKIKLVKEFLKWGKSEMTFYKK